MYKFFGVKNETRVLVKPLGYLASPRGLDVVNVHFLAEIHLSGIILSLEWAVWGVGEKWKTNLPVDNPFLDGGNVLA